MSVRLPASTEPTWAALSGTKETPAAFDASTLEDVPAPAARWLGRALPESTPLSSGVLLSMSGRIRIGRWMPFTAEQVLRAGVGFVWKPVVGRRLLRFVGADILGPDDARMEFRLHGLVPVAKAEGPDTRRSAAGRLAAETIAWVPQALTPQRGARWSPVDDERSSVRLDAAGETIDVEVTVDDDGRLRALRLQRWNDAVGPAAFAPFGGTVTAEFVTPAGVRVAGAGTVGWGFGTDEWERGAFFDYSIQRAAHIP